MRKPSTSSIKEFTGIILVVTIVFVFGLLEGGLIDTARDTERAKNFLVAQELRWKVDSLIMYLTAVEWRVVQTVRMSDCYENQVAKLLLAHVAPPDTVWVDKYTPFGVVRIPKEVRWPDPCIRGKHFDVPTVDWLVEKRQAKFVHEAARLAAQEVDSTLWNVQ